MRILCNNICMYSSCSRRRCCLLRARVCLHRSRRIQSDGVEFASTIGASIRNEFANANLNGVQLMRTRCNERFRRKSRRIRLVDSARWHANSSRLFISTTTDQQKSPSITSRKCHWRLFNSKENFFSPDKFVFWRDDEIPFVSNELFDLCWLI